MLMNKHAEPTGKQARQSAILEAVGAEPIGTQNDLVKALKKRGISATQVSISRDVAELGLVKVSGVYKTVPTEGAADPELPLKAFVRKVEAAGPNLTVIRCDVGTAPRVGLVLDGLTGLPGLVGTLAGDDTVFVACASSAAQKKLIEYLSTRAARA